MENYENCKTVSFSKNEKIVRFICFAGVILCAIIGILLFFLNKVGIGIAIICTCVFSFILLLKPIICKIKIIFEKQEKRRVFYAIIYIIIILIPMLTAFISTYNLSLDVSELEPLAIEAAEESIKTNETITVYKTEVLEKFENGSNYYFFMQTKIEVTGIGGAISTKYPETFAKVNKYTGRVTLITYTEYIRAGM